MVLSGSGKRVIPQFFEKYRLSTQNSYHFTKHPFKSKLPRFYLGLRNVGRWIMWDTQIMVVIDSIILKNWVYSRMPIYLYVQLASLELRLSFSSISQPKMHQSKKILAIFKRRPWGFQNNPKFGWFWAKLWHFQKSNVLRKLKIYLYFEVNGHIILFLENFFFL